MADLSIEELLPRANYSIYKLVRMAATRALELSDGRRCLAENSTTEKFTTMALEEIAQGKVHMKGADASKVVDENVQEETDEDDQE
jgi:DNA-directed RNA polymerase omega subunit